MFKLLFIWMSFFHLEQLQSYFFPSYNSNILHRQHFHFASVQVRSLLLNSHPQSDPLQKGNSRWDCEMLQSLFGSSPTPASPVCQLHASTVFYEALCTLIKGFDQLCCESIILPPSFVSLRENDIQVDSLWAAGIRLPSKNVSVLIPLRKRWYDNTTSY